MDRVGLAEQLFQLGVPQVHGKEVGETEELINGSVIEELLAPFPQQTGGGPGTRGSGQRPQGLLEVSVMLEPRGGFPMQVAALPGFQGPMPGHELAHQRMGGEPLSLGAGFRLHEEASPDEIGQDFLGARDAERLAESGGETIEGGRSPE
jgi:hypothetical protein